METITVRVFRVVSCNDGHLTISLIVAVYQRFCMIAFFCLTSLL